MPNIIQRLFSNFFMRSCSNIQEKLFCCYNKQQTETFEKSLTFLNASSFVLVKLIYLEDLSKKTMTMPREAQRKPTTRRKWRTNRELFRAVSAFSLLEKALTIGQEMLVWANKKRHARTLFPSFRLRLESRIHCVSAPSCFSLNFLAA